MDDVTRAQFEDVQSCLDDVSVPLRGEQYRELLEEIKSECEVRLMALAEDSAGHG